MIAVAHTNDPRGTGNLFYHGGTVDYHGVLHSRFEICYKNA